MSTCRAVDVFPLIAASYGSSGMCPAGPNGEFTESQQQELLTALNQGLPIIMKRLDAKGTLARWTVPVRGGVFTLPPDCIDVRQAFLNGCSMTLRDQWYEGQIGHRMSACDRSCGGGDLMDLGDGFAIPEEWPSDHFDVRYGLMAESDSDAGKTVQVKFKNKYGHTMEEIVTLLPNQQVASTEEAVSDVLYQFKGVTDGAVVGFITYPEGQKVRLLRMPANVASPSYHKKKMPRVMWDCTGELSIIGKIRFTPLVSVTDTLPICDEAALSFLLQALNHMKNRDLGAFNEALTLSVNELLKQLQDVHPSGVVTQMQMKAPARYGRPAWPVNWTGWRPTF